MKELSDAPHFITSMQELIIKRAQSSRWQSTLDKLSDGLVANLEIWKKNNFPSEKYAYKEPKTLCGSLGSNWKYQWHYGDIFSQPLKIHFDAWKRTFFNGQIYTSNNFGFEWTWDWQITLSG